MTSSVDSASTIGRLGFAGRYLATKHPHIFFGVAAVEVGTFAVIGAILMPRSVASGIVTIVCGLVSAAFAAWPGWWSQRNPQRAEALARQRHEMSQRMARRHPLYLVVVLPIVIAVDAALRWHGDSGGDKAHQGIWSWVIPAAIGLLVGAVAGTVLVVRARRAGRRARAQASRFANHDLPWSLGSR